MPFRAQQQTNGSIWPNRDFYGQGEKLAFLEGFVLVNVAIGNKDFYVVNGIKIVIFICASNRQCLLYDGRTQGK